MNLRAPGCWSEHAPSSCPLAGGSLVALTSDHTVGNVAYGATKAAMDRVVVATFHEFGGDGLPRTSSTPVPLTPAGCSTLTASTCATDRPAGTGDVGNRVPHAVRRMAMDHEQAMIR